MRKYPLEAYKAKNRTRPAREHKQSKDAIWFRNQAARHREEIKALRWEIASFVDRMRISFIGELIVTEFAAKVKAIKPT